MNNCIRVFVLTGLIIAAMIGCKKQTPTVPALKGYIEKMGGMRTGRGHYYSDCWLCTGYSSYDTDYYYTATFEIKGGDSSIVFEGETLKFGSWNGTVINFVGVTDGLLYYCDGDSMTYQDHQYNTGEGYFNDMATP